MQSELKLVNIRTDSLTEVGSSYDHQALNTLRDRIKKITTPEGNFFLQVGDNAALQVPELYVSIKDTYPIDVYTNQFYDNAFSAELTVFLQHIAGTSNQQMSNILITTNTSNTKHPRLPSTARREFARAIPEQGETFFDVNDLEGEDGPEPESKRRKAMESTVTIHEGLESEGIKFSIDEDKYINPVETAYNRRPVMFDYHGTRSHSQYMQTSVVSSHKDSNTMNVYDTSIRLFDIPTYTHFAIQIEGLHDSKYLQPNIVAALEKAVSMIKARGPLRLHGEMFNKNEYSESKLNISDLINKGFETITNNQEESDVKKQINKLKDIICFFLIRYVVRLTNIQNEPAFKPVTFWLYDFEHKDLLIVAVNIIGREEMLKDVDMTKPLQGFSSNDQEVVIALSHIIAFVLQKGTEYYITEYKNKCKELRHPIFKDVVETQRFADLVSVQFAISKAANPSGSYTPVGELERLQRQQSYILNYFSSL